MAKKVALIVASEGYQETEYEVTKKVLQDAGIEVVTVSNEAGTAIGHQGGTTNATLAFKDLRPAQYDGIFLIGGPKALEHLNTDHMYRVLSEVFAVGKPYGAICISPRILAFAQVLRGKKATCWDGDGKTAAIFAEGDVTFEPHDVVVDGLAVTANGPQAAQAFGAAIVKLVQ